MSSAQKLRDLLAKPGCLTMPGVYDAMSAKLAERAGFEAAFMSGFAVSGGPLRHARHGPDQLYGNGRPGAQHVRRNGHSHHR